MGGRGRIAVGGRRARVRRGAASVLVRGAARPRGGVKAHLAKAAIPRATTGQATSTRSEKPTSRRISGSPRSRTREAASPSAAIRTDHMMAAMVIRGAWRK
jgi:hypothetical protein